MGGRARMVRILWTICFGDWVGLYLAYPNAADPVTIDAIEESKNRLT